MEPHSHTLPDDGRSISRNVAEKHYDSTHDKLKNSMNTTESTNTNIFKTHFLLNDVFVLFRSFDQIIINILSFEKDLLRLKKR